MLDKLLLIELMTLDCGLPQAGLRVMVRIVNHYNLDTDLCCPAVATISRALGLTERGTQKGLRVGEARGWARIDFRAGPSGTNLYWPNFAVARRYGEAQRRGKAAMDRFIAEFVPPWRTEDRLGPEPIRSREVPGRSPKTIEQNLIGKHRRSLPEAAPVGEILAEDKWGNLPRNEDVPGDELLDLLFEQRIDVDAVKMRFPAQLQDLQSHVARGQISLDCAYRTIRDLLEEAVCDGTG